MPSEQLLIRRAAMDLLARREHSAFELQQKLSQRFEDKTLIEQAVISLQDDNLQSDQRFAEQYIRMRANKGYGWLKISQELQQKGIADVIKAQALASNALDWQSLLIQQYTKKYGNNAPSNLQEKARCQRFLLSRGFSFDQLNQLFKSLR